VPVKKTGSGTLILAGNNLYTGNTMISTGVLAIAASGSISHSEVISVTNNAIFDVSAWASGYAITNNQRLEGSGSVTGSVIVSSGAVIAAGASNTVGILTLRNNLTLQSGSVINWNYSRSANTTDVINVAGTLTLPATATINVSGTGAMLDRGLMFSAGSLAGATDLSGWTIVGAEEHLHVNAVIYGNQVKLCVADGTEFKFF
jgi:autotransporter-associated beta strand protein